MAADIAGAAGQQDIHRIALPPSGNFAVNESALFDPAPATKPPDTPYCAIGLVRATLPALGPVFAIPIDKRRNADRHRGARGKAQVAADIFDIGEGLIDVAVLHRQQIYFGLAIAGGFDRADQVGQLFGPVVADIVKPVRGL